MPSAGYKLAIAATKRLQTYALDGTSTLLFWRVYFMSAFLDLYVQQSDIGWHETKRLCEKLKLLQTRPEVSSFICWIPLLNVVKKMDFFSECLYAVHWVRCNLDERNIRTIDGNNQKFTETRTHSSLAEISMIRPRRTQYHTSSRCKSKSLNFL